MINLKNFKWLLLMIVFLYVTMVSWRTPSQDKNWIEDIATLSQAKWSEDNSTFMLQNIRDWRYSDTEVLEKTFINKSYNIEHLESLWLYVQPIGLGEAIAHTFLIFKFKGDSPQVSLGISIESRLEVGESYSPIGGILRQLELHYTWALEEDLVQRRATYLDYPLKRYKIKAKKANIQALLRQLLSTTNALSQTPRWYNTLLDNCTNALLSSVNEISEGTIPLHYSFVLTGYVAAYLDSLGYIDKSVPMMYITKRWLESHTIQESREL